MMKISLVLDAIDRASGPIRRIMTSIERMGWTAARTSRQVGGSMMFMRDQVIDATHHFRRLAGEDGMLRASRSADYLKRQVSGLTSGLSVLKYAGGAAIVGLGEEFVRGVFKAGGETQQMLVTLNRLEGSATRAKQAMSWMQNFSMGAGAAFKMPDIMRSYQMAKNFGMDPQGGALTSFADLAGAERVPLKQVLIAVKDAMEGTSTRPIANLGIKMRQGKGGGPNTYLYQDLISKKWITDQSEKTPEGTLAALLKIINRKYSGIALAQAKTVPGGFAQLQNLLYGFESKVASSGVLDWALVQINNILAWARKLSGDGTFDRAAKTISNFITGAGDKLASFVRNTNWRIVGEDLKILAGTIGALAGALGFVTNIGGGGLSGLFNIFVVSKIIGITAALTGFVPVVTSAILVLTGFEIAAAPIELIIGAIGALVVVGYLLWANWGKIMKWFRGVWDAMPGWVKTSVAVVATAIDPFLLGSKRIQAAWAPLLGFFSNLWGSIKRVFTTSVPKLEAMVPSWAKTIGIGMLGVTLGAPGLALGAAIGGKPSAPPAKHAPMSGHITVELTGKTDSARVTKLKSSHPAVGLSVKRGPVMPGG